MKSKRVPYRAGLLSFLVAGLGQLYNGEIKKATRYFTVYFLVGTLGIFFIGTFQGLLLYIGLILLCWIFLITEAVQSARRLGEVELQPFQKKKIYAAVVFVSIGLNLLVDWIQPYQAFHIPSGSMIPTSLPGEHLMADQKAYKERPPRRGEVVLFRSPRDKKITYIKRLVGLPGDKIEIIKNRLHINGKPTRQIKSAERPVDSKERRTNHLEFYREILGPSKHWVAHDPHARVRSFGPFEVEEGQFFVMGDNREHSHDSRYFGPLPMDHLIGKPLYYYISYRKTTLRWSRIGQSIQ